MTSRASLDDAVVPAGDVTVAEVVWRFQGSLLVTVIAKASFAFARDAAMARVAAQPIVREEVHHGNTPMNSVRLTSDLVPYLGRADVLFNGRAHAPPDEERETMRVRLGVFDGATAVLDKSLVIREKGGFTSVPIVYERAYGGVGWAENIFGVGVTTGTGEPSVLDPADPKRVAGLGPIGTGWPARRRLLRSTPRAALKGPVLAIPDDFDWSYFQSAPPDQRLRALRGDEWIVMDGLHPTSPRLRMRIPSAHGRAWVHGLGAPEGKTLGLAADTLRIDGDEQICSLTFRTAFAVPSEEALAALRVVVGVESEGVAIPWPASVSPRRAAALPVAAVAMEDDRLDGAITLQVGAPSAVDPQATLVFHGGSRHEAVREDEPATAILRFSAQDLGIPASVVRDLLERPTAIAPVAAPLERPTAIAPVDVRSRALPFVAAPGGRSPYAQSARPGRTSDRDLPRPSEGFGDTMIETTEEREHARVAPVLPFAGAPAPGPAGSPPQPVDADAAADGVDASAAADGVEEERVKQPEGKPPPPPSPAPPQEIAADRAASPWTPPADPEPAPAPPPPKPRPITVARPAAGAEFKKGVYGRFENKG